MASRVIWTAMKSDINAWVKDCQACAGQCHQAASRHHPTHPCTATEVLVHPRGPGGPPTHLEGGLLVPVHHGGQNQQMVGGRLHGHNGGGDLR